MKQKYNAALVNALAKKYKITPRYVRYCLKGERSPHFAENIEKDYKRFISKIENVIERECKLK